MTELYSKAEDCSKLANYLYKRLHGKVEFSGSTFQEVIYGKYHCLPFNAYENYEEYRKDELSFSYKFCENGFLRISVENVISKKSLGHKLAVLSDFYIALSELYGLPTVFYTIKDDEDESINLQWSFIQKEEDIKEFKEGTAFDDAETDELIIFGEQSNINELSDKTKTYISNQIGLPIELIYLLDANIDDFLSYKQGIATASTKQSEPVLSKKTPTDK